MQEDGTDIPIETIAKGTNLADDVVTSILGNPNQSTCIKFNPIIRSMKLPIKENFVYYLQEELHAPATVVERFIENFDALENFAKKRTKQIA